MKNKSRVWLVMPIIFLGTYLTFYSSIETKPSDAGFWIILALGISLGILICRLIKK